MRHRLRDSAVRRRQHRQAGRHRLEHRVRHALLILIRRHLARMQENVRRARKAAASSACERKPRSSTASATPSSRAISASSSAFIGPSPAITKSRLRMLRVKFRERPQRRPQPLLLRSTGTPARTATSHPPASAAAETGTRSSGIPVRFSRSFSARTAQRLQPATSATASAPAPAAPSATASRICAS